jgi:hypothetical protein
MPRVPASPMCILRCVLATYRHQVRTGARYRSFGISHLSLWRLEEPLKKSTIQIRMATRSASDLPIPKQGVHTSSRSIGLVRFHRK